MLILSLDIATSTGWAVYDPDRPNATVCGAIDLSIPDSKKLTSMEVRRLMRPKMDEAVCGLIDRWRPDFACLEQPLNFIGSNEPKPKKAPLLASIEQPAQPHGKKKGGGGPNANTAFLLNQLFAVAYTVCHHKIKEVIEVAPTTWQTLTKSYPGDTKTRSIAFCRANRVQLPALNKIAMGDAADAVVIAYWAAGKAQELRYQERVYEAEMQAKRDAQARAA